MNKHSTEECGNLNAWKVRSNRYHGEENRYRGTYSGDWNNSNRGQSNYFTPNRSGREEQRSDRKVQRNEGMVERTKKPVEISNVRPIERTNEGGNFFRKDMRQNNLVPRNKPSERPRNDLVCYNCDMV